MEENKEIGRKVTINLLKANIFSLILMGVSTVVLLSLFFMIWKEHKSMDEIFNFSVNGLVIIILVVIGIVIHELIHGLTWAYYAKSGWKSIKIGMMWKTLTPYCHCNEPLPIQKYKVGVIMPCIILGIIPAIIALAIGNLLLLIWGIFFITVAAGDIWMVWLLGKEKSDNMIIDHPTEAGFYVIEEQD